MSTRCSSNGCFAIVDGAGDLVRRRPVGAAVETCTEIARSGARRGADLDRRDLSAARPRRCAGAMRTRRLHDHPVLGEVPFLKWFVNIRQSTSGGDNTLNRGVTTGTGREPDPQRPRGGLSRGLRFRRPRQLAVHHLDRAVGPFPVAPLRRSGRALAARRIHPDDARPGAGAGGLGGGDAAGTAGIGRQGRGTARCPPPKAAPLADAGAARARVGPAPAGSKPLTWPGYPPAREGWASSDRGSSP